MWNLRFRCNWQAYFVMQPPLGLYSLSGRTSYRKISWSLEVTQDSGLDFSNRSEIWQAHRQRCCRNARSISLLWYFTRSYGKTPACLVNRDPESWHRWERLREIRDMDSSPDKCKRIENQTALSSSMHSLSRQYVVVWLNNIISSTTRRITSNCMHVERKHCTQKHTQNKRIR